MVQLKHRLDLDFPVLSPAGEARVIRRTQELATRAARRRIIDEWKPQMPVRKRGGARLASKGGAKIYRSGKKKGQAVRRTRGALKRSFRSIIPRPPKSRGFFTAFRVDFLFYLWLQRINTDVQAHIRHSERHIVETALAQALEETGNL